MKHLEISIRVREDDEQPESIVYQRSIIIPDGPQADDWREESVARIKRASDEVAQMLTNGITQRARA